MGNKKGPIRSLVDRTTLCLSHIKGKILWTLGRPDKITLNDLPVGPLRFHAYSRTERYRSAGYGGEREALEHFLEMLEPTDVVYDIGASIGLYTIAAAKSLENGKVCAFEPDPDTRARLLENIRVNQCENVEVMNWAVTDAEGETALFTDGATGLAPSLFRQNREKTPTGHVRVQTHSLDHALSTRMLAQPNVIKIDVEGAEGLCLKGAKRLLRGELGKRPRILFLEIHPDFLPAFGSSGEEIKSELFGLGYELCWSRARDEQEHLCVIDAST